MTMKMIVTVSPAVGAGTGRSGDVARGDECSSWLTLLPFFLHQSFVTWMTGMTLLVGITGKPFRSSTTDVTSWPPPSLKWATVCLNILDSAKAENCTSFHFLSVRPCTGGTSHFFSMYKGIYAIRIITGPMKPYKCIRNPFFPGYLCIPDQNTPNQTTLPRNHLSIRLLHSSPPSMTSWPPWLPWP